MVATKVYPGLFVEAYELASAELAREMNQNRGVSLTFRGASSRLLTLDDPEVIISGPASTGKTIAGLYRLNRIAWEFPGVQLAIVRKTYASMPGTVLQSFRQKILGKDSPVVPFGGERPEWFDYPNGSRIWVGGMDNPNRILSAERDIIYVNQAEELTLEDWETLLTRATGRAGNLPFGQVVGDCNPSSERHWIPMRATEGQLTLLTSRHQDNPRLFDDAGNMTEAGARELAVLDRLTGVRRLRLRDGKWSSVEGAVYPEFDRGRNIVTLADLVAWGVLTEDGKRGESARFAFASVDWGFTNPGVIHVWLVDGDGRMFQVVELYRTGQVIDWWIERAKELKTEWGVREWTCDPAEPSYIQQFKDAGLWATAANNAIAPGVQAVASRLVPAQDGRPRLHFYANALREPDEDLIENRKPHCTTHEIESYVWPKAGDGRAVKEVPVKVDDHAMDCMRYGVMFANDNKRSAAEKMRAALAAQR